MNEEGKIYAANKILEPKCSQMSELDKCIGNRKSLHGLLQLFTCNINVYRIYSVHVYVTAVCAPILPTKRIQCLFCLTADQEIMSTLISKYESNDEDSIASAALKKRHFLEETMKQTTTFNCLSYSGS